MSSCKKDDTAKQAETIKDIDGNVYKTVTIGTQIWMAENLKVTKYRNGDLIGTTYPANLDISAQNTPKYQWSYEGNEDNIVPYGRLYTWYAATDSRNICPTGWHISSEAEWKTLRDNIGGESVAGDKLKESGTTHWRNAGTNSTGFTGLPGGCRDNSFFTNIGETGNWWTSTENSLEGAQFIALDQSTVLSIYSYSKIEGFSVRCIKDN